MRSRPGRHRPAPHRGKDFLGAAMTVAIIGASRGLGRGAAEAVVAAFARLADSVRAFDPDLVVQFSP